VRTAEEGKGNAPAGYEGCVLLSRELANKKENPGVFYRYQGEGDLNRRLETGLQFEVIRKTSNRVEKIEWILRDSDREKNSEGLPSRGKLVGHKH